MKAYKVNAGMHIDKVTGRQYKKDEIIESEEPLTQMFPQKFTDLGDVDNLPKVKSARIKVRSSEDDAKLGDEEDEKAGVTKGKKSWD